MGGAGLKLHERQVTQHTRRAWWTFCLASRRRFQIEVNRGDVLAVTFPERSGNESSNEENHNGDDRSRTV